MVCNKWPETGGRTAWENQMAEAHSYGRRYLSLALVVIGQASRVKGSLSKVPSLHSNVANMHGVQLDAELLLK